MVLIMLTEGLIGDPNVFGLFFVRLKEAEGFLIGVEEKSDGSEEKGVGQVKGESMAL